MEFYLGQIFIAGWNFAPRGSVLCHGQLMQIGSFSALFSLFGTTYGGDGRTTFGVPDLQGRAPIGQGQGAGLDYYGWGQKGGVEQVTLGVSNLPSHSHATGGGLTIGAAKGASDDPLNNYLGNSGATNPVYRENGVAGSTTKGGEGIIIGNTGGGQPFYPRGPYLPLYFCVAITGVYPTRS